NVVRVTATSVADPSKSAFIDVTIISLILVTISPSNSNIELDTAQTFTATVGGTTNQNVIWDVNGVVGGNATLGTITNPGSGPATYTAPASLPNPATVTLTAKWNDPSATAQDQASVSVTLFSTISIALSAPSSVRAVNRRVTITGTITRQGGIAPLNKAVTWRVNGVPGGNSTVGQICLVEANRTSTNCVSNTVSNGDFPVDYLAPAAVPAGNPVTIEAESQADTSRKGNFQVTVQPTVTVSIAPLTSTLPPNQRQIFVATVLGSDFNTSTWQVNGVLNGDATNGTICLSGSNPCTAPPNPATQVEFLSPGAPPPNPPVKVRATSADDPTQFAEASVTIQTGAFITSIQPASITAGPANSFTLRVRGSNFSVNPLSTIKFNGNSLTTSCASSTECTATISAASVSAAGNFGVQVENPSGATFPGLSNSVNMVVVAQTSSEAVITLDPNNPTATGQDITVVEPTTSGSPQGPAAQVNVETIGIISGNSCPLRGSPIRILRPASGSPPNVVNICLSGVLGSSALNASFAYSLSGPNPADVTITSVQNFGSGGNVVQITLSVPSSAQTGPRTIFVENAQKEKSALVGSIEIK
ncbi:MAG TPA: hypothetical protein VNL38_02705, partial [Candidatus Nitrosotenuis sp.]|nr:hypothetical protein [Candidatus Nitrosotenuis sp.]